MDPKKNLDPSTLPECKDLVASGAKLISLGSFSGDELAAAAAGALNTTLAGAAGKVGAHGKVG